MRIRPALAAIAALCAAAVTLSPASAQADPSFSPISRESVTFVGSDTLQDVINGIADGTTTLPGYNDSHIAGRFASWDAIGPSPIVPKESATPISRPNGSIHGLGALINSMGSPGNWDIDVARSFRKLNTNGTENGLASWAFARDGIAIAKDGSASYAPANLSIAQLTDIYNCVPGRDWGFYLGTAGQPIVAVLPHAGSGLRATFLTSLGIDPASPTRSCWSTDTTQPYAPTFQPSQGLLVDGNPNAIAPYSIANYVAQGAGAVDNERFDAVLIRVNGTRPLEADASFNHDDTGSFPTYSLPMQSDVYLITRSNEWARYAALFGPNGYTCSNEGDAIIRHYGFALATATFSFQNCGETIIQ